MDVHNRRIVPIFVKWTEIKIDMPDVINIGR